jgi:hypothetical protein
MSITNFARRLRKYLAGQASPSARATGSPRRFGGGAHRLAPA